MRYIFLGGLYPKNKEEHLLSRCVDNFQVAANVLQWKIVEGLEVLTGRSVSLLTLPFVGDFPRHYRDICVPGSELSHRDGACDLSMGFLNIRVLNIFSKYIQCKRGLKRILSEVGVDEDICIVVYGAFPYHIFPLAEIKKNYPNARVCLVVPDLPDMMGGDKSRLLIKAFNWLNGRALRRSLEIVDYFVLISKFMADKLPMNDRPWCVIEGIADSSSDKSMVKKYDKRIIILYSGTLARRYGICELLDAFQRIRCTHYRLWICGVGDGASEVYAAANTDKRITYFGQLPIDEVSKLQANATLLINPRTSFGEYTKYSFPSKIMEYLSSGTPCIMHRLPGVPDEYFDYCLVPSFESVDGILQAILDAEQLGGDRLYEIGLRAKKFIQSEKTAQHQCKKIISMVERREIYFQ